MATHDTAANEPLRTIYIDHHGWLTGWLMTKLGCPHSAADLSQDTFERVMSRCDPAAVSNHRPWLLTIAKRLLIDKTRRHKLEHTYLEQLKLLHDAEIVPSEEEWLQAVQLLEQLASALDTLNDKARQAFVLWNIEGLSQIEIGQRLGVSVTTVRKHLAQGLVACHDLIDEASL